MNINNKIAVLYIWSRIIGDGLVNKCKIVVHACVSLGIHTHVTNEANHRRHCNRILTRNYGINYMGMHCRIGVTCVYNGHVCYTLV